MINLISSPTGTVVYYDVVATGTDIIVCNKTNPDLVDLDFSNAAVSVFNFSMLL